MDDSKIEACYARFSSVLAVGSEGLGTTSVGLAPGPCTPFCSSKSYRCLTSRYLVKELSDCFIVGK